MIRPEGFSDVIDDHEIALAITWNVVMVRNRHFNRYTGRYLVLDFSAYFSWGIRGATWSIGSMRIVRNDRSRSAEPVLRIPHARRDPSFLE